MDELEKIRITVGMGAKLRQARVNKGWTQADLANQINASQTQIDHYEKGDYDMALARLFDLAQMLGVSVPELYEE
ncbi:MAG: helix-turn-helix transcriptional regulator [Clostridiaceae bacterium]|nr:helix-turn-helix transcriptional regulator [Clostridiaceae bacterium]